MRLEELLKGVQIINSKLSLDEEIEKPCSDSRKCKNNSIFIAIRGQKRDGNEYIDEAFKNGAKCVITDQESTFLKIDNCVLVENSRRALAFVWNNYYCSPCENIKIIGITGTNGKTSCAYFLHSILMNAKKRVGLISTVECLINGESLDINGGGEVVDIDSAMTTPDPEILYGIFSKMRDENVEFVVMEVSSHALEHCRVDPIRFFGAVFTNLSAEHLDFHKNMESYFNSKKKLFEKTKFGIVNSDDDYGKRILSDAVCEIWSVSTIRNADFYANSIALSSHGINYFLNFERTQLKIQTKISGRYTVYNSMLALACAIRLGINEDEALIGISSLEIIPGRMEKVFDDVFIDYAHTPVAFENVLRAVREMSPNGRIIVVFGCGGDRDKEKRPQMGKIASKMADKVIISSDNSRSEKKNQIIIDILNGVDGENFEVIPNRRDAIKRAIEIKRENDVLLLLGKGHEKYEIDTYGKHYFSEKDIVSEAINDKNKSNNYF